MSRVVFYRGKFKVIQIGLSSFIVVRKYPTRYEEHSHLSSLQGAIHLIKLIDQNHMPTSKYLRESARRILKEKEFERLEVIN
ncbi:MAG: hypothetical protein GX829_00935 [Clostridium sp.]|jgi:hypothetical protein|nr:hypothetical protein [Clostridium sp.]